MLFYWRDNEMIKELIQTVVLALGTYKLFEILVKWCESIVEKYN